MYTHVLTLAKAVQEGAEKAGVKVTLRQVAETLPKDVLEKMHAPAKPEDIPIATPDDLSKADGVIFGFPTRFGMMASQMKAFFDSTGSLWQSGALVGKPAGMITSTATQNGGQETTQWSAVSQLTHHGMLFVPAGYICGGTQFDLTEVHGGSPYGPGTLAGGDGSRMPSEKELDYARAYGAHFAGVVKALKAGRASLKVAEEGAGLDPTGAEDKKYLDPVRTEGEGQVSSGSSNGPEREADAATSTSSGPAASTSSNSGCCTVS